MEVALEAGKAGGRILTQSQLAQNTGTRVDEGVFVKTGAKALKTLIIDAPLRGADAQGTKKLVSTDPAEAVCGDHLSSAHGGQCGVLVEHDHACYGYRKSAAAHIVARARSDTQPKKFLIVSPGPKATTGDARLTERKRQLKIPEANAYTLAKIVVKTFRSDV